MVCAASPKVIINDGGFAVGRSGLAVHTGDFGSRIPVLISRITGHIGFSA
jgi:hypothetical protein